MERLHFRKGSVLDLTWVASRMRQDDEMGESGWAILNAIVTRPSQIYALVNARGEPFVVAGGTQISPKSVHLWLLSSIDLSPHTFQLRRLVEKHRKDLHFPGCDFVTRCPIQWDTANNWLRHLGFIRTGQSGSFNLYRWS